MSHVAKVQRLVKSLESLKRAAKAMGLELRLGQKTFKWYGRWMNDFDRNDAAYKLGIRPEDYGKCEHAIAVTDAPDAYEIGLIPDKSGKGWALLVDEYDPGKKLMDKVGTGCNLLLKEYSYQLAALQAQPFLQQGFKLQRVQQAGATQVVLTR